MVPILRMLVQTQTAEPLNPLLHVLIDAAIAFAIALLAYLTFRLKEQTKRAVRRRSVPRRKRSARARIPRKPVP